MKVKKQILLINGSPRAPHSHSKQFASLFRKFCRVPSDYACITSTNHAALCQRMENYSDVVLVFPLYVDSLPVRLLEFLKSVEAYRLSHRPVVSVVINCGFFEPKQNDVAVDMIRLFCAQNGFSFGSALKIGSGEAVLATPFRFLLALQIYRLVSDICRNHYATLSFTMPIPLATFIKASFGYWALLGKRNGISREQMETMKIEDDTPANPQT